MDSEPYKINRHHLELLAEYISYTNLNDADNKVIADMTSTGNYNDSTIESFVAMNRVFSENPCEEIELVDGLDSYCEACCNEGSCKENMKYAKSRKTYFDFGFKMGEVFSTEDLRKRIELINLVTQTRRKLRASMGFRD